MKAKGLTRRDLLKAGSMLAGTSLLAACGGGGTPAATSAPTGAAATGAAATAAPTAAATSAAQALAALEEAAKKEDGELLWYNAGNPTLVAKVTEGFKAAYPWVKFQGVSVVFSEMPNKLITERVTGAPTADVIWCPPTLRQGWLKNDVVAKVPLVNDALMPKEALDPDGWGHPVWQLLITIQYNTASGVKPPNDPAELADAAWKGKLAFDRVQNLGQSTTWLSVWRQKMGDAKWQSWLDGLKANQPFIAPNAGTVYDLVLRGERPIGLASSNYVLAGKAGAPVAMHFGIKPVPFYNHSYLTARARRPKTGQLFMEWSATQAGQKAIADSGLSPIMDIDVPSAPKKFLPSGVTPVTAGDLADFAAKTDEYVKILGDKFPS